MEKEVIHEEQEGREGIKWEVNTITQETVLTLEEEVMNKEREDKRETSFRIDVVPQEPASTPVEVVMREASAQAGNEDDESIPRPLFQSMMPRGARGFRSPKRLMEEVVVPPVLKFVDLGYYMANIGPVIAKSLLEYLETRKEYEVPTETP